MRGYYKVAIALLLIICVAFSAMPQSRGSRGNEMFNFASRKTETIRNKQSSGQHKDYALYRLVTRQNGWVVGVGPQLSDEEASYLGCYYKLSKKNEAGHWTHVEALNGRGRYTTDHDLRPYAIPSSDTYGADSAWVKKCKDICRWEYAYDGKGERVTMERSYDANGKLVSSFRPMQVNDSVFIGTYFDHIGFPANLRKNDTDATLVRVTTDRNGFTSRVELLDGDGENIGNKDDVYITAYTFDKDGYLLCKTYLNPMGEMLDYATQLYHWDKKRGLLIAESTLLFFNKEVFLSGNGIHDFDITKLDHTKYSYDGYGRRIVESKYSGTGEKDSNYSGTHAKKTKYNRFGEWTELNYYNKDGSLNNDYNDNAKEIREFDNYGNRILYALFDKNGAPVCYRSESKWDGPENLISRITYDIKNGEIVPVYKYVKDGDVEITEWEKENVALDDSRAMYRYYEKVTPQTIEQRYLCGLVSIDSIDSRGNTISTEYFDEDHNRVIPPSRTYSYGKARFDYDGDNYISYTNYYDNEGKPCQQSHDSAASNLIIEYDAKTNTYTRKCRDSEGLPYRFESERYNQKNESEELTSLSVLGHPCRSEYYSGNFYIAKGIANIEGSYTSFGILNEWGEPAYVVFLDGKSGYEHRTNEGWFDEFGNRIENMGQWVKTVPKVLSIECIDQKAFDYGFKDNDIIVQYGDWHYPIDGTTRYEDMYLSMILNAGKEKTVRVLRHDLENQTSMIVTLPTLPPGTLSEFGVVEHTGFYTKQELGRLTATLSDFIKETGIPWHDNEVRSYGSSDERAVTILVPQKSYNSYFYYHQNLRDANIHLDKIEDGNGHSVYRYTPDLANCKELEYPSTDENVTSYSITLTEEEYARYSKMLNNSETNNEN